MAAGFSPGSPRPTKQWIYDEYAQRINIYSNLHNELLTDEMYWKLAFRSNLGGLPENATVRLPPTAANAVQTFVDHVLLGETPEITVILPPGLRKASSRTQEKVEKVRSWLKAVIRRIESRSDETPFRDFVAKAGALGQGVLAYPINWDYWPERINRKPGESPAEFSVRKKQQAMQQAMSFPFDVRSAHPVNIYPDPSSTPPRDFIEVRPKTWRAYPQLDPHWRGRYPAIPSRPERPGYDRPLTDRYNKMVGTPAKSEVEELVYCSPDWIACYANGIPILTEDDGADEDGVAPNLTGEVWYKMATGGAGYADREERPEARYAGLLRNGRDILEVEAESFNQVNALRALTAYGSWKATHVDGPEAAKEATRQLTYGPATVFHQGPELTLEAMVGPVVPPAVFQTLDLEKEYINQTFGSQVLRGISGDSGTAASRYRTQLAEARLMFGATKHSCQQAIGGMFMGMLNMIQCYPEEFSDGVSVFSQEDGGYLTLKPDDIPPGLIVLLELMPPTGEEKAYKVQEGLQLLKEGGISMTRYLSEYAGVDDPLSELRNMAKDKVRREVYAAVSAVAIQAVQQSLQQRIPGISASLGASPAPQPPSLNPSPAAQEGVPSPGPGGLTLPGEQPPLPLLAGTQEGLNGMRPPLAQPGGMGMNQPLQGMR